MKLTLITNQEGNVILFNKCKVTIYYGGRSMNVFNCLCVCVFFYVYNFLFTKEIILVLSKGHDLHKFKNLHRMKYVHCKRCTRLIFTYCSCLFNDRLGMG